MDLGSTPTATPAAGIDAAPQRAAYPAHLIETIRLRDGTPMAIRPIHPDDFQLELDFVRRLSARSAYQRLLSPRRPRLREIRRWVEIDYSRELALIATAAVDGQVRQIGVARYAPEPDGSSCDFGIVVADEWQGRGVGEALLRALVCAAVAARVPELTGLTLATNQAMRDLARKVGFSVHRDPHDGTVVLLRMPLLDAAQDERWPCAARPRAATFATAPATPRH